MGTTMREGYRVITENWTVQPNATQVAISGFLHAATLSHQQYITSLVLSCIYTIILFPVGLFGNILILAVNLDHRGRLAAPDLYFVNLAVADLTLVADSVIEVFNLKQGYYNNAGLCTFMNLFQKVNMYSSVFFLTWMSFDRFVALTSSIGHSLSHAWLSCCLIWAFSSLLTLLPFTVAQVQHAGELHFCFANMTQILWLEVMLGFVLPFCILGLCYWRIMLVLQHSQREQSRSSPQQKPRRQKALRMIAAAVLVFFLCWLPENAFISVHLLRGNTDNGTLWQDYPLTGHAVRLAAFSNSCLNPLIYGFLGETFRKKLRLFLQNKCRWTKLERSASGKSIYLPAIQTCPHDSCDTQSQVSNSNSTILPQTVIHHSKRDTQAAHKTHQCQTT
ncbi:G-protein coupled estrogen receptor 1-like [Cololabis saira]|uniref:G-protein coupled estrogen receptor 1-like n=1 Tax=Cololabis saira TaxID=129043 RepID=UPI002AD403EF|nr:G-protein coupled estrogen receptor 1-like [Cololabis saira]XP_061563606.1 G-protein coupled estrogen receptor 1-like [Cololabis saira]